LNIKFEFPEKQILKNKLINLLEESTDEKYYIPKEKADKLLDYLVGKEISNTIRVAGRSAYDKKHN
jgi:hypothetical protein